MVVQYQTSDNQYLIIVGENAKENDKIRQEASQNDLWFHLEDVSSPHVILKPNNSSSSSSSFPAQAIYYAGVLCKAYSKQKATQTSSVIYAPRKSVKTVKEIDGRVEVKGHVEKMKVYRDDTIKETLKKVV
ncbi:predicted protein [Naegleria gruberi]|uniref:Predicted protein n=1 Tax=Naegleria gruberi TaxID=5762 RepID=D2VTE8_NAEGR|nr:uncharacterized protein NAEGRDRAFT_72274 [Naegleria gruberi]EFC39849.1 predicted protein [Naegleria gruberi]|eukprot:XP_002672593.1 predicted protein [Naegleria gruberi strain NEG-M]